MINNVIAGVPAQRVVFQGVWTCIWAILLVGTNLTIPFLWHLDKVKEIMCFIYFIIEKRCFGLDISNITPFNSLGKATEHYAALISKVQVMICMSCNGRIVFHRRGVLITQGACWIHTTKALHAWYKTVIGNASLRLYVPVPSNAIIATACTQEARLPSHSRRRRFLSLAIWKHLFLISLNKQKKQAKLLSLVWFEFALDSFYI